jgi:hypothetical protein
MYKILAIFSNHTYDIIKYNVTLNNLSYILPHVTDAIIIDSINEEYALKLKTDLIHESKIKNFYFVKNNTIYLDFGKWIYVLEQTHNLNEYDYILFINDSIIITYDMFKYFEYLNNSTEKINIYGYNDSSQIQYHYQSYLFMFKTDIIPKFIEFYEIKKPLIHDINTLIQNMELNFYSIDEFHDVFIKIGKEENIKKNIFWENDKLYEYLLTNNILCLIKLKRIFDIQKDYNYEYFHHIPLNFNHSFYRETYSDVSKLTNNDLEKHFLKIGQYEGRYFTYNSIKPLLPDFLRSVLKKINMLEFFDISENYDLFSIKKINNNKGKKNKDVIIDDIKNNKKIININFYLNIMKKMGYINKFLTITNDEYINKSINLKDYGPVGIIGFISLDLIKDYNINTYIHLYDNTSFISNKLNNFNSLPIDFDINIYKELNEDIITNDYENHFITKGISEKRLYRLPHDYNPDVYKTLYQTHDDYIKSGFKNGKLYKIPDDFNFEKYRLKMSNNFDNQTIMRFYIHSTKYRNLNI